VFPPAIVACLMSTGGACAIMAGNCLAVCLSPIP
jgi:hypothetical protein